MFSAALVKGVGEGCKTNLCFLNLFLRKTHLRFEEPTYQKNVFVWGIPSTSHTFVRKGLEVNLALPFS